MSNNRPASKRIYWRKDRETWWADFRDFPDPVCQEVLGTNGRKTLDASSKDEDGRNDAETEAGDLLAKLRAREKDYADSGVTDVSVDEFIESHRQALAGEIDPDSISDHVRVLERFNNWLKEHNDFADADRGPNVSELRSTHVREFRDHLKDQPSHKGGTLEASTVNTYLRYVSRFLSRAVNEDRLEKNPYQSVRKLKEKSEEREFLEVDEAAALLEAAEEMVNDSRSRCYYALYEIIATFLLTGGRRMEVLGLMWRDVDFESGIIHFRSNEYRPLKFDTHKRWLRLWPQLESILRDYREDLGDPDGLLFPAYSGGLLNDLRSAVDTMTKRAGVEKHITPHVFRHTYTATRMMTVEDDLPVSIYQVAEDLGHKNLEEIKNRYGHLQQRPQRLEEVRYE